jgi:hypothetical protein
MRKNGIEPVNMAERTVQETNRGQPQEFTASDVIERSEPPPVVLLKYSFKAGLTSFGNHEVNP